MTDTDNMNWKVLGTSPVVQSPWFNVTKERVQLPNGKVIDDFYTLRGDDLIAVLALRQDGKVAFIRQYRHGIKKSILEIPGGGVDQGEQPLEAAKRELLEETGLIAQEWHELGQAYLDPARSNVLQTFFLAVDAKLQGGNKDIEFEAQYVDIKEALQNATELGIVGMSTILALNYYQAKDFGAIE